MVETPIGWCSRILGEVATLQRGADLPTSLRETGPYPVVGSNGVIGTHSSFVGKGPGVTVGRSGSVGKVIWIESDYWPLNTALWVKDFHGNDRRFVYFLLRHLNLGRYAEGVSVPTLNRNIVHPVEINIPPLPEQRAIAVALRAVQDARDARHRELDAERERKAALMEDLFTYGVRGEPQKETNIGLMPSSWRVQRLGDAILHIGNGLTVTQNKEAVGYAVTRIETIANDRINPDRVGYVADVSADQITKFRLQMGDILISHINSEPQIGRSVMFTGNPSMLLHGMNLLRVQPNREIIVPGFLDFTLKMYRKRGVFVGMAARAVGQASINQGRMTAMPIPIPSLDEQQEIADVLTACDGKIAALESEAALHDELFRALLDELMTGRVSAVPLMGNQV